MVKLKNADHPEGQREDYLFITNEETGDRFKALHELKHTDIDQPVLIISIAPVDEVGKAIRLETESPDVTYHSHTFTEEEMSQPGFELDGRVAEILRNLVDRKQSEMVARKGVFAIGESWKKGSINLEAKVS